MTALSEAVNKISRLERRVGRLETIESVAGSGGSGAPTGASYVVTASDTTLTSERILTAGSGLGLTDGGAGCPVTLYLAASTGLNFSGSVVTVAASELIHNSLSGLADGNPHPQYTGAASTASSISGSWTFTASPPFDVTASGSVANFNADYLDSQHGAYYLDRTNHTSTQGASTIVDFDTEVSNNTDVAANTACRHNAVTLATDAASLLGLSTQQLTLNSKNANTVFAGPVSGGAADPNFRALVEADIPTHGASKITSGCLAIARGGTELATAPSAGRLLIGKTNNLWSVATLTAGPNIWITNGDGSITVSACSGSSTTVPAQYVVMTATACLANERVLTAGSGISITDGGAGNAVTAGLNINGLTAATCIANDDTIPVYDTSATGPRKFTQNELLKTQPAGIWRLNSSGCAWTYHTYIDYAINNSGSGDVIELDQDVSVSGSIKIDKRVTLRGISPEITITRSNTADVGTIGNGIKVTGTSASFAAIENLSLSFPAAGLNYAYGVVLDSSAYLRDVYVDVTGAGSNNAAVTTGEGEPFVTTITGGVLSASGGASSADLYITQACSITYLRGPVLAHNTINNPNSGCVIGWWHDASGNTYNSGNANAQLVGEVKMWPTNTAPAGWLLCYGQAISRTTYAGLYAVVGTTFGGGDGSTTFNVPDFRGRVPLGQDDMGGSAANRVTAAAADTIGGSGGAETHTLTTDEIPSHSHPLRTPGAAGSDYTLDTVGSKTIQWDANYMQSAGGGSAHNNLQPYLTINYIIFAGV